MKEIDLLPADTEIPAPATTNFFLAVQSLQQALQRSTGFIILVVKIDLYSTLMLVTILGLCKWAPIYIRLIGIKIFLINNTLSLGYSNIPP
jgi:hypothetical protein